jgi:hypothetical protein
MTTPNMARALLALALALPACVAPEDVQVQEDPPGAAAGTENTYDHPEASIDVWRLLARKEKEGPDSFSSRVHGCPKIKYASIGGLLRSRGVNLDNGGDSAGGIYRNADLALGIANYEARKPEAVALTASSAAKLFDIFLAAAPEIIQNMPNMPACQIGGVGVKLFDDDGTCNRDGITCLIGVPASSTQVELCDQMVLHATTPEKGRVIAVAALLAAAHTCE